jgi:hypothetical protein
MFGSKRKKEPTLEELLANFKPVFSPNIVITQATDYRPCYVNGRRALWHRWVNTARPQLPKGQEPDENARYFQFRSTHGLVEYEDGTLELVWPRDIQFADHGRFEDYAWLPADRRED